MKPHPGGGLGWVFLYFQQCVLIVRAAKENGPGGGLRSAKAVQQNPESLAPGMLTVISGREQFPYDCAAAPMLFSAATAFLIAVIRQ
jgi:hypothetical protein